MSCCDCNDESSARIPCDVNQVNVIRGNIHDERHLGEGTDLAEPEDCIVHQLPVSDDDYLNEVKLENIKEEHCEIKIEEDGSEDELEVNLFRHQFENGNRESNHTTEHSIDDLISLGLQFGRVKEEKNEYPADNYEMALDKGPLNNGSSVLNEEVCTSESNAYGPEAVNSQSITSEISTSFKTALKTPNAIERAPIKKEKGPRRNFSLLRYKLATLFHSIDRMYHCDQCEYKAKFAQTMEYHRATHTGEKPYECKFCDYKAGHPTTLRRHMRRHTGEKPHACKFCEYKAAQPQAVIQHMRYVHTGEKPYSCELCSFKAHDQGSLASHKLSHLSPDDRPFECDICGIKMTRRRHLKRHALKKHPGQNISLAKRSVSSKKGGPQFEASAALNKFLIPRKRKPRRRFGSSCGSSSPSTSDDDQSTSDVPILTSSGGDTEYRPDRCITLSSDSSLMGRPRRSIVAPRKLDL